MIEGNMDDTDTLTPRQERFCREFLVDMNGTKASVRAGYGERSAHVTASRLLTNTKVAARVAELQAETAKRLEVTADTVMADLARLCQEAVEAKQFGPAVRAKESWDQLKCLTRRHRSWWLTMTEWLNGIGGKKTYRPALRPRVVAIITLSFPTPAPRL